VRAGAAGTQAPSRKAIDKAGATLLALAKALRTLSMMPVYLAGLDRELAPTAD